MPDKEKEPYDMTESTSDRGDDETTRLAREHSANREGNAPYGNVASPEGDADGENRVTTSLSED